MSEMYESSDVMVSHPKHYQSSNGLECIDVIKRHTEHLKGIYAVDTANCIKYAWRWKAKNGVQDIEKIIWYATDLLNALESKSRPIGMHDFFAECKDSELRKAIDAATENLDPIESDYTGTIIEMCCTWKHAGDILLLLRNANLLLIYEKEKK